MREAVRTGFRGRARTFWKRHRTLFWTLHSLWAMATGVVVLLLARERYGFVQWVVVFLGLTWLSTLYFGRVGGRDEDVGDDDAKPGVAEEATSYLTRTMYQETLFFLLPFYAYSTVLTSPNVLTVTVLGGLAFVSCLDLVFDRWLRSSPVVRLMFFAVVTFAAVNLLLPILVSVDPTTGSRLAAGVAVVTALPLALQGTAAVGRARILLALGMAAFLTITLAFPRVVPPVPLRLMTATFASGIDRESLALPDTLRGRVAADDVREGIYVLMEVFAPAIVPTAVNLRWERDGQAVRESRTIEITAHETGFRIWDAWRPDDAPVPPGHYEVILETRSRRVFGLARLEVGP